MNIRLIITVFPWLVIFLTIRDVLSKSNLTGQSSFSAGYVYQDHDGKVKYENLNEFWKQLGNQSLPLGSEAHPVAYFYQKALQNQNPFEITSISLCQDNTYLVKTQQGNITMYFMGHPKSKEILNAEDGSIILEDKAGKANISLKFDTEGKNIDINETTGCQSETALFESDKDYVLFVCTDGIPMAVATKELNKPGKQRYVVEALESFGNAVEYSIINFSGQLIDYESSNGTKWILCTVNEFGKIFLTFPKCPINEINKDFPCYHEFEDENKRSITIEILQKNARRKTKGYDLNNLLQKNISEKTRVNDLLRDEIDKMNESKDYYYPYNTKSYVEKKKLTPSNDSGDNSKFSVAFNSTEKAADDFSVEDEKNDLLNINEDKQMNGNTSSNTSHIGHFGPNITDIFVKAGNLSENNTIKYEVYSDSHDRGNSSKQISNPLGQEDNGTRNTLDKNAIIIVVGVFCAVVILQNVLAVSWLFWLSRRPHATNWRDL